jgi:hypothetical protein
MNVRGTIGRHRKPQLLGVYLAVASLLIALVAYVGLSLRSNSQADSVAAPRNVAVNHAADNQRLTSPGGAGAQAAKPAPGGAPGKAAPGGVGAPAKPVPGGAGAPGKAKAAGDDSDDSSPAQAPSADVNVHSVDLATLKAATKTERGEAVFWTGRIGGVSVEVAAGGFASANGGFTLEQKLANAGVSMPVFNDRTPEAIATWEAASRLFAEQASGVVTVFKGTEIRQGNVFDTLELPALKRNTAVSQVFAVDGATGKRTQIFVRHDEL